MNTDHPKRKAPRIDFYLPITVKGHEGVKETKDFSLSGIFIQMEDVSQFEQGEEIELVMELPHQKRPIQVRARVMRVTSNGIGVEFIDLSPPDAMALESCFNLFKHTMPLPGS